MRTPLRPRTPLAPATRSAKTHRAVSQPVASVSEPEPLFLRTGTRGQVARRVLLRQHHTHLAATGESPPTRGEQGTAWHLAPSGPVVALVATYETRLLLRGRPRAGAAGGRPCVRSPTGRARRLGPAGEWTAQFR